MGSWPIPTTGIYLEGMNPTVQVGASYTANPGDFIEYTPTAASTVLLPSVPAFPGAVVTVVNMAAFAITIKPATADQATVKVNGIAGGTGYILPIGGTGVSATKVTLVNDGSNWYSAA